MNVIRFPKRITLGLCPLDGADIIAMPKMRKPLVVAWFQFWVNWTRWVLWL